MKARVMSAGLKMFIPVPPNISLARMTLKATAKASIHKGRVTGTIMGMMIPDTR